MCVQEITVSRAYSKCNPTELDYFAFFVLVTFYLRLYLIEVGLQKKI